MPIIKKLFSALAVAILATVGAFVAATPAHAASGYVTCATSNVVGVWVDMSMAERMAGHIAVGVVTLTTTPTTPRESAGA